MLDRSTAFIVDLERRYSGRDILLVSHGDTLQILRAGFLRMNPSQHRSLPELKTAEIRQLRLVAAHQPRLLFRSQADNHLCSYDVHDGESMHSQIHP